MPMAPQGIGRLCAAALLAVASGEEVSSNIAFSQRLFESALDLANESLHGQFISQMADGSLPPEAFRRYLYQDNLYLGKYARAFASLASKAATGDEFVWLANHSVLATFEHGPGAGSALDDITFDSMAMPVTVEYTSFFSGAVAEEGPIMAYASMLPCQKLYDWLFATLASTRTISHGNPYRAFIYQYADPRNHHETKAMEAFLDRHAARGPTDGVAERAREHYRRAMRYEAEFFAQGLSGSAPVPVVTRAGRRGPWISPSPAATRGEGALDDRAAVMLME